MTYFASLRYSSDRQPAKPKIIDVDEVSEKRFRLKVWKKKIKKKVTPAASSSTKKDEAAMITSITSRTASWDSHGDDPAASTNAAIPAMTTSSSMSSMSTICSASPGRGEKKKKFNIVKYMKRRSKSRNVPTTTQATATTKTSRSLAAKTTATPKVAPEKAQAVTTVVPKVDTQLINVMLVAGIVHAILVSQRAWRIEMGLERAKNPDPLPMELMMEIVLFRWPLKVEVPQEPTAVQKTAAASEGKELVVKTDKDKQLEALQEQIANLNTITELLSKQLVESTLNNKKEAAVQKQEATKYQEIIQQMQEQHRAECAALVSDKKYLEGQLRHNKIEQIPPIVGMNEETKKVLAKLRRSNSFTNSFVESVQACLKNPDLTSKSGSTAGAAGSSFSMASNMILQHRLLPAMLSAVATANSQAAQLK